MPGFRGQSLTLLAFRVLLALGLVFCPLLQGSAFPAVLPVPASSSGQTEEEKSEEVKSVGEWAAPARGDRKPTPPSSDERPVAAPARVPDSSSARALPRAASADPFRNGLGCPFRC
jgi:hypothetical protein